MIKLIFGCILACSLLASRVSAATLLGDEFEGTSRVPHSQDAMVIASKDAVAPAAQFLFATGKIKPTATKLATSVVINFPGNGKYELSDFDGIQLKNLSRSNIAGFAHDPSSTVSGLDQRRLRFGSDSLFFNFSRLSSQADDQISGNIAVVETAAPKPGTWALMLLGFGLVGRAMRSARTSRMRLSFT